MISVEKARELLGAKAVGKTDEEIRVFRDQVYQSAALLIQAYRIHVAAKEERRP